MRAFASALLLTTFISIPLSAFALEGIGPRVTVTGIVNELRLTEKQRFDQEGGELVMTAANGQIVTIVIAKETTIMSEGRLSRKLLIPENLTPGLQVRVRGWRVDGNTLTASLVIIMNIENNPGLSGNGVIQAIDGATIRVLGQDGKERSYSVTNETEVNVNYTLRGTPGLSLIGKQVLLTLNPQNTTQVRIMRIIGVDPIRTTYPTR